MTMTIFQSQLKIAISFLLLSSLMTTYFLTSYEHSISVSLSLPSKHTSTDTTSQSSSFLHTSSETAYILPKYHRLLHYKLLKSKTKKIIETFQKLKPERYATVLLLLQDGDIHPNPGTEKNKTTTHKNHTKPFSPSSSKPTNRLSIAHLNIRSICNKISQLHALLEIHNFDILCLTETWLKPAIKDIEITPPGYSIVRLDRSTKKGGGVAIIYRTNLKLTLLDLSFSQNYNAEIICSKIQINNSKAINIICAYIPPGNNIPTLEHILEQISNKLPQETLFLGEFNIDWISCSNINPTSHINLNGFKQLINSPTRTNKKSKKETTLDWILTNSPLQNYQTGILPDDISDHSLIYVVRAKTNLNFPTTHKTLYSKKILFLNSFKQNFHNITGPL
ncbi:uncharacterized protein LOC122804195 [Protopterus annectens]|uniref:uncharacterized protein LOC122804195 n=1 Tax=Protopterus annectens TaxID=7888 RepID=UPI001CFB1B60|nr:uncharacterized protein LOC122804195 [Protopterus annectens]